MAEISLRNYLQQIETLLEENRLVEAIAHCRHILEQYPRHIPTYRLLGKALLERGEHDDAADIFRRVLSADPEDFVAHVGLAIVSQEAGDWQEATWHMERAFDMDPYNNVIQQELRTLYGRRAGNPPERLALTHEALARLYVKGELYQQAVAELRQCLNGDGGRVDLQSLLAEALWRDGQKVESVEVCLKLLDTLPYCIKANAILAEVWLSTGRIEEAQPYLRRVQELLLLDAFHLQPDTPAAQAFRIEGAMMLPNDVRVQTLDDEQLMAAELAHSAGWLTELEWDEETTPGEQPSGEGQLDWLAALQAATEEEQPADEAGDEATEAPFTAGPDPEAGTVEEASEWSDDQYTPAEAAQAYADLPGWLQQSLAEDTWDDTAGDMPEWLRQAGLSEEEMPPVATTDMLRLREEDQSAEAETPAAAEPEAEARPDSDIGDDSAEEIPDWLSTFDEAAPLAAGVAAEDPTLDWLADYDEEERPEPETTATEDALPDWLGDFAADDEEPLTMASMDAGDLADWLATEESTTEPEEAGSPAADEVPDWLRDEELPAADEPPDEGDIPEWLGEFEAGEETPAMAASAGIVGHEALTEDEMPAGEDAQDWEKALMSDSIEQEDRPEDDDRIDDVPDELEADLAWLDDVASALGTPPEELPSLYDEEAAGSTTDLYPDWLTGDLDDLSELEESGEQTELDLKAALAAAGDDDNDLEPADIPDWLRESAEAAGIDLAAETGREPRMADDDLSWLDQIAAGEGAAIEEGPTLSWGEAPPEARFAAEDDDDLGWLEELAEATDRPAVEEEAPPELPGHVEVEMEAASAEVEEASPDLDLGEMPEDFDLGEVPEDLEEAMAWLETLAARQGAALDELPTITDTAVVAEADTPISQAWEAEPVAEVDDVPDDPDEALAWLEQMAAEDLAARTSAAEPQPEPTTAADTRLEVEPEVGEAPAEPPEPIEIEALAPPEELEVEHFPAGSDEEMAESLLDAIPDDPDAAMAWLEQLAARQGAPLEELPMVDEVQEEIIMPDWMAREVSESEAAETIEVETETVEIEIEAEPAAAEPEPEPEPVAEEPPAPQPVPTLDLRAQIDEAMPDWLSIDLGDEPEDLAIDWDSFESDVTGWLKAEDELHGKEIDTGPLPPIDTGPLREQQAASHPPQPQLQSAPPELEQEAEAPPPPEPESVPLDDPLLERAWQLVNAGDYHTAVAEYQTLVERGEHLDSLITHLRQVPVDRRSRPVVRRLLGDAYMRNGQLQEALNVYREALDAM